MCNLVEAVVVIREVLDSFSRLAIVISQISLCNDFFPSLLFCHLTSLDPACMVVSPNGLFEYCFLYAS